MIDTISSDSRVLTINIYLWAGKPVKSLLFRDSSGTATARHSSNRRVRIELVLKMDLRCGRPPTSTTGKKTSMKFNIPHAGWIPQMGAKSCHRLLTSPLVLLQKRCRKADFSTKRGTRRHRAGHAFHDWFRPKIRRRRVLTLRVRYTNHWAKKPGRYRGKHEMEFSVFIDSSEMCIMNSVQKTRPTIFCAWWDVSKKWLVKTMKKCLWLFEQKLMNTFQI